MLNEAGINTAEVLAESGCHLLHSPEDWWAIVLGPEYRGTVEQLDLDARERLPEPFHHAAPGTAGKWKACS
jgi:hypothetical protein